MEAHVDEVEVENTCVKMETGQTESEVMIGGQSENSVQDAAEENPGDSPNKVLEGDPVEGTECDQTDGQDANQKEGSEMALMWLEIVRLQKSLKKSTRIFYLKRDEFTSEIFKIELSNLPLKFGFGGNNWKKKLISLKLKPNKIKAIPYKTFAYITFRAMSGGGSTLKVKKANPTADPLQKKRKENQEKPDCSANKKAKMSAEDQIPWNIKLKNSVTPLWEMEYDEQLKVKTEIIKDVLRKLGRQMDCQCEHLKPWLRQQRSANGGLCCELLPILRSPILTGYRNKCEFTLGCSPEGQEKTLGFRLGKYSGGSSSVGEPYECSLLSEKMKHIVKVFQEYFRASKYAAFDPETHKGNWRQLTVRETRSGEIMTFPEFHPQEFTQEEIEAEVKFLQDYFMTGPGKDSGIAAMYFSVSSERISGTATLPTRHVFGEKYITEDLLEMKFRISPDAFFQVNTAAAEVLYKTVADWCNASPTTTVLDICCGTGTIGQSMSKRVGKVVGIEMCRSAVEDAKENVKLNNLDNVEYFCGKAEDVITGVTMRLDRNEDVVAVVDPPRAGLHPKVVKSLRRCARLKKVIYVSCSPQSAQQNFLDLCRPTSRKVKGEPYRLVKAIPVDLFPQTKLCELILMFERESSGEEEVVKPNQ
ncbi:tRNA (uracil-5-)-methyltransferase homolog A-like [Liolophura sinensis]|uniref:tRNA (uracil-5-)-methyltransferase homolog A-like n=1 Tax=Liolophura sinensis TaxID=3198878 RepID=UPI003157FB26